MSYNYNISIYIGNDFEDRLKILEMEYYLLRKYNEYHQVVHEIDHMSDSHVDSSFYKQSVKVINPIQAGLFWNHIGWGGAHCAPLCFSSICCPITTKLGMLVLWHKISQKQ